MRKDATPLIANTRLRDARTWNGWSQQELADKIGTTKLNISRWERNVTLPGPYFRQKLSDLFGKSLEELGLGTEKKLALSATQANESAAPKLLISDPALPSLPHFVGREEHTQYLVDLLCRNSGNETCAIVGLPGVGKTTLVVALAHNPLIRQHFREGILWCGLSRSMPITEQLSRWGRLLGLTEAHMGALTSIDAWARCLHEHIGDRRMLFILDDAWDLASALIFHLGGSRCAYVLTTRFPIIASSFARNHVLRLHELSEEKSMALLQKLAPQITSHYLPDAHKLVKLIGGLPLALTLMGRYLYVQAQQGQPRRTSTALLRLCKDVAERLQLEEPAVPWESSSPGAFLSLQSTIMLSENELPPQAKTLLHALSVFPPKPLDFSEAAALAVSAVPVEMIDVLTDSGLLESNQPGRYQLHQIIADYAALRRADSEIEARLVIFVCAFLEENKYKYDAIERELHLVLIALEYAHKSCLYRDLIQGVLALAPFLENRRLYALAEEVLKQAREGATRLDERASLMQIWLHQGKMAEYRSSFIEAEQAYLEGLTLARQSVDMPLVATFLIRAATVLDDLGAFSTGKQYLLEALTIVQMLDDRVQLCSVLQQLGENADELGQSRRANMFYLRGLRVARQAENWQVASALLQNLGVKALKRGQYKQAGQYFAEGMTLAIQEDDLSRQSALLMNQGMLAFSQHHLTEAINLSLESLHLARLLGHRMRMSSVLQNLGMFEGALDHASQAEVYLQESLDIACSIGHQWLICETRCVWGFHSIRQKNMSLARSFFLEAEAEAREMGTPLLIAHALFGLVHSQERRSGMW